MPDFPAGLRFLATAVLAALTLAASTTAVAQKRYHDVPVLVVGEDEDPRTVKRSHEIFRGVIAELKGVMSRSGFSVMDEEAVSVDLGWEVRDRRPKAELIDLAKLMNRSGDATHGVRALVAVSVRVEVRALDALTRMRVRMSGDIYDVASNQFIDTSGEMARSFVAPPNCDLGCISRLAAQRAREVASIVGEALGAKLARYRDPSLDDTPGPVEPPPAVKQGRPDHGIETPYTVTFFYFDRREALTIIGVMADEFPGYKSHRLISTDQGARKYAYITTADAGKIEEWLAVLLDDMNFDPDKEVRIAIEGTGITVEKIIATGDRPPSADEKALFK